jgi:hypothetical protein
MVTGCQQPDLLAPGHFTPLNRLHPQIGTMAPDE